jgi:hypothetical protein
VSGGDPLAIAYVALSDDEILRMWDAGREEAACSESACCAKPLSCVA